MNWWRRRIEIVRTPVMTEPEINKALLSVGDTDPLWRAVLQLLEEFRDDAYTSAAIESNKNNSLSTHGFLGGAQHLENFRVELIARRDQQIQSLRKIPSRQKLAEAREEV